MTVTGGPIFVDIAGDQGPENNCAADRALVASLSTCRHADALPLLRGGG
jgi:hypothetical protein